MGVEHEVRRDHFAHFRNLVAVDNLAQAHDLDRAVRLSPEWSNIAAALAWGTDQARWEDAADLAAGCLGLWEDVVPTVEGKRWVQMILPHVDQTLLPAQLLETGLAAFEAQLDNFDAVKSHLKSLVASTLPEIQANAYALRGYLAARVTPEASPPQFEAAQALIREHDLGEDLSLIHI